MRSGHGALYRYVVVLLIIVLGAIASGAVITSNQNAQGQRQFAANGVSSGTATYNIVHNSLSIVGSVLILGLAVLLTSTKADHRLRGLGWVSFGVLALCGALGWVSAPISAWNSFFHACLAHASFAGISAIAVLTSSGWDRGPEPVADRGWTAVRPLATATPPAVFIQIILGALYRHQLIGVMAHIAGALVVVLLALICSVIVLQHFPEHRPLRRAASFVIFSVVAQVCLGIAAFIMPLLGSSDNLTLVIVTTAHVLVGAVTLASSIAMALVVRRNILQRVQPQNTT